MLCATPLTAQPFGLTDPAEYEALVSCLTEVRETDQDISVCKNAGAPVCDDDPAICLTGSQGAWTALALVKGGVLFQRGEGQPGFSKPAFLATLERRLADRRQRCFAFPVGQETEVAECLLDAGIDEVRWMYATGDAMDAWTFEPRLLTEQAQSNLTCMMAKPSREGPEACGLKPYHEPCRDAGMSVAALARLARSDRVFRNGCTGRSAQTIEIKPGCSDLFDRSAIREFGGDTGRSRPGLRSGGRGRGHA